MTDKIIFDIHCKIVDLVLDPAMYKYLLWSNKNNFFVDT